MITKTKLTVMAITASFLFMLAAFSGSGLALATPPPVEMQYGCVHQGSDKISYSSDQLCGNNETLITFSSAAPLQVCAKPNDVRLGSCNGSGTLLTVPNTSGPVYFCADNKKGDLRYVTNPNQCGSKETAVVVSKANQPPTNISLSNSSVAENQPSVTTVGTFSTTDPDAGDSHTYGLVAGTGSADNGSFQIVGNQLKTAASFNFESKSSYSIRVQTNDGNGGTFEKQFTISVTNVNEAPTDISLSNSSVAENQPSGTTVGTLSTTDPDAGNGHSYTLVAGAGSTDNASFTIVGTALKTAASLDFEAKSSYSVRVRSTDGGLFTEKQFTITVTNVNENPIDISLSNSSVDEDKPVGSTVGTFSTDDPDASDPDTYTLVAGAGDSDNASFQITGATLKTNAVFDYATKSSYTIRVRGADSGGLFIEKQFTITVNDVNHTPTNISLSNSSVAENQPSGTTVGTLSTTDPDAGNGHSYTLVAGAGSTDNASFTIVGTALKTAASLDFEAKSSYSVRVRSTDGGLFTEKQFTITVTNVNENPIDISLSNSSVDEDKPVGSTVGTFSTDDPDASDPDTYTLVAGAGDSDNASFQITGATLKTNAVFDYATKSSYTIRVRGADSGGLFIEKQFTITVNDVNHTPTNISLSNSSVAENQPSGTTVGALSTTDPDPADSHTYTLVAGAGDDDNAAFTITGATLKTAASFNFESKASYSIRVSTDDGHGSTFEKQFTISVSNVNEAPTDISLSNSSVAENQPSGTTVGTLSTTDPDAGNGHSYTLVAGAGSTDNASFTIVGTALKTAASLDFEAKSSYSVRVRSTDSGGLSTEKQFTITVTNVNEAPTDISLSNSSVSEHEPAGTLVGDFSTADPDTGDSHLYTLVSGTGDDDNGQFQLASNHLQTAATFDYATKSSYTIRVRSTDVGGLFVEEQFTITVTRLNQAPVNTVPGAQSVNEDTNLVFSSANSNAISISDPDAGSADVKVSLEVLSGTLTLPSTTGLTFVDGTANGQAVVNFTGSIAAINAALNGLTYRGNANFNSTQGAESLTITTNDGGNSGPGGPLLDSDSVAITVNAVNDAPLAAGQTFTAQANMKIALSGLLGGASDPDAVDAGYTPAFTLVDVLADNCSGCTVTNVNSAAGSFDFDPPAGGVGPYTLKYRVADSGNPAPGVNSAYATISVTVNGPVIWFVNPNTASNGDGRLSNPFNTLAAADAVDAANERIFLYSGTAATGISLNPGEWLVGQGVTGASFDSVFGINPPAGTIARPAVNGARPVVQGRVVMFASTVVRGLLIQPASSVPGITGNNVNSVTIGEVSVTTVATQSVYFQNLFGVASVTDSSFTAGAGDNFRLDNSANTLDRLTLDNVTFGDNGVAGGSNLYILARLNAVVNVTVQNSTFTASRDTGLALNASEHSVVDVAFTGNTMRNTRSGILSGASNISLSLGGGTIGNPHNATVTYNIANSTFRDARGSAVATKKGGIGTGAMTGTITGNTIGVAGVARSGSFAGSGIVAELVGGGSYNATISNNTIYQFANYGILVQGGGTTAGGGQGYLTSTVKGNTVAQPFAGAGFPTNGLEIVAGTNGNDTTKFCLTLGGTAVADKNVLAGTGTNGGADLDLFQDFKTILGVPGYVGANNSDALMQTFLASRNVATTVAASNNTGSGGPGYSGTCP